MIDILADRFLLRNSGRNFDESDSLVKMSNINERSTNTANSNAQILFKTWINICSLCNTILATIVSISVIIYVLMMYISKKNSKKSFHLSLILTCNTSLTILCSSITLSLMTLSSLSNDQNLVCLQPVTSWFCHLRGYLIYVFIVSLYLSYILQAGYRYFRIVYHKHRYLRTISTFSCYIFGQWILSLILMLPILILDENYSSLITYLSEYSNCLIPFTNIRGVLFITIIVYILPLSILCWIYSQIIIHLRRKSNEPISTLKLRRQNKRDATVIKRIYTVIIVLATLCCPLILFFICYLITGHLHWSAYRICWMAISISLAFISLSSLYVTPQIYKQIQRICGCSKRSKKYYRVSYSINIFIDREKKIESIILENTTFSHPNILPTND